jgi:hypothetical protein
MVLSDNNRRDFPDYGRLGWPSLWSVLERTWEPTCRAVR